MPHEIHHHIAEAERRLRHFDQWEGEDATGAATAANAHATLALALTTAQSQGGPPPLESVAQAFAEAWSDDILVNENAPGLSCTEANTLVALLRSLGHDDTADMWATAHANGDEPGDEHHQPDA